jgi:hypothetical protein
MMKMKLYPKGPPRSEPSQPKPPPSKEDLAARKARQAEEGVLAMAEYERQQKETLERTARLRAERLAREAKAREAKARESKARTRKSKGGEANTGDAGLTQ